MIIYQAKNKINGKLYIGKTKDSLRKRKNRHQKNRFKNNKCPKFYNSIRKYGINNFEWNIIHQTDNQEQLNKLQKYYIKIFKTQINGYNVKPGGEGKDFNGMIQTKQKIRLRSIKMWKQKRQFVLNKLNIRMTPQVNKKRLNAIKESYQNGRMKKWSYFYILFDIKNEKHYIIFFKKRLINTCNELNINQRMIRKYENKTIYKKQWFLKKFIKKLVFEKELLNLINKYKNQKQIQQDNNLKEIINQYLAKTNINDNIQKRKEKTKENRINSNKNIQKYNELKHKLNYIGGK